MKISRSWLKRLMGNLAVVLACQLILMGAVVAQEDSGESRRLLQDRKEVKAESESLNLRIIGKRPELIMTEHRNFRIMIETEVVNSKDQPMELADLPVPCKATIYYQPGKRRSPIVWLIVYKGKLKGAKTAWLAPIPE